jgi:quinol-cytochrome oxidoreductase complex cytochrome b subunit
MRTGHSGATGWEALIPLDWNRLSELTNEPVPNHIKRWWFSLGGTPAYLFLIQITTGILLTFYYQPTVDAAYESVSRITFQVPYGWFIRSVHKWSANLMIITVLLHMLRVFFTRSYRHPRTLNWVFGAALLTLTMSFGFTGYSLVYEQLSFWGATVAANLTDSVPVVGPALATLIRGGPEVGPTTLTRLYLLHIGLLPVLLVATLGLHLTFVRLHGVTDDEFEKLGDRTERRFAGPLAEWLLAGACGFGAVVCVVSAFAKTPVFDFLGYGLLPGTSRMVFVIMAATLAAGAVGLLKRHLSGYLIFLTAAVLLFGKLLRDLLTREAESAPMALGLLLITSLLLVVAFLSHRRFRETEKEDEPKTFNFFPDHMLTELMVGTGLLILLTLLCLVFPAELSEKANPNVTPEHIKPEWYFYFQFRMLKLTPGLLGLTSLQVSVLLTGLMLAIFFLWPWFDALIERVAPGKNLPLYIGIVGFLTFLAFTVWESMVH